MKRNPLSIIFKLLSNKQEDNTAKEDVAKCLPPEAKQIILALGPLFLTIGFGMIMGYSATLLPQLQDKNETIVTIDQSEASWIASMAALPMALGCIFGGVLIEHFGRKATHLLTCGPICIGWLLIYIADNIEMILVGRFVTGLCCGILSSATGVFIGETSSPAIRGFLLGAISFSVAIGLFLVHLIGTFTHWQTTALVSCIIPLFSVALLLFVPESPAWLVKKGKIKSAERAFHWCRGYSDEAQRELNILLDKQPKENEKEVKEGLGESIKEYLVPEFVKPLGIIVVFIVANQFMGVNVIAFYTISILNETLSKNFNEYLAMLLVDFIRVIVSVIACILLRKFGRRPLAFISGVGTAFSMITLSGFLYFSHIYPKIQTHSYIPIVALIAYISFIQIGFVPLPWSMIGELFPLKHRSIGSAITSFMAMIATFTVVKTAPSMFATFKLYGTFFIYGMVAIMGSLFVYLCLPETKGKMLYEIEEEFRKKSAKKNVQTKYDDDNNFA